MPVQLAVLSASVEVDGRRLERWKEQSFNSFLSGHTRYEEARHRGNWIMIRGMIQGSFYTWFCSLLIKSRDGEIERGLGVNGHDAEASRKLIGLS